MDRVAELQRLAHGIEAAASRNDWAAVMHIEQNLARSFEALAARGPWTAAEHRMLEALQAARERVFAQCSRTVAQLEQRLVSLREHREGWLAYANNDKDDLR